MGRLLGLVLYPFMVSVQQGADTLIWLASSPQAANADGNYFVKRRRGRVASFATDAAAERLWDESVKRVEPYSGFV